MNAIKVKLCGGMMMMLMTMVGGGDGAATPQQTLDRLLTRSNVDPYIKYINM